MQIGVIVAVVAVLAVLALLPLVQSLLSLQSLRSLQSLQSLLSLPHESEFKSSVRNQGDSPIKPGVLITNFDPEEFFE